MRLYYERLDAYTSYDLAWLGPIVYPLTLALIAQVIIYADIFRSRWGRKVLPLPRPTLLKGDSEVNTTPDTRIDAVTVVIMLAESIFAVACIAQCIINFDHKGFVGGGSACDLQAFYATYYNFSSIALSAYGLSIGCAFVVSQGRSPWLRLGRLLAGGSAIHAAALLLASLPLTGVGGYQFSQVRLRGFVGLAPPDPSPAHARPARAVTRAAPRTHPRAGFHLRAPPPAQDYCMYRVEGGFFSALLLSAYAVCGLVVVASARKLLHWASDQSADTDAQRRFRRGARRLAVGTTVYFFAINLTSVVIALLFLANGAVLTTPQWPVYGFQAIILHSNQLFVPILFGWQWRRYMHAALSFGEPGSCTSALQEPIKPADESVQSPPPSPPSSDRPAETIVSVPSDPAPDGDAVEAIDSADHLTLEDVAA